MYVNLKAPLFLFQQVRLNSVPLGSAESLRLSYKSGLGRLVQVYTAYLHRNIQETPGPPKHRTRPASGPRQANTFSITKMTCSSKNISADKYNDTTTSNSTADIKRSCKTDGSREDFGRNVPDVSNETTVGAVNRKTLNNSTGYGRAEEVNTLGLLVIELSRNVSHSVRHHPCQSPAIQQALVTRIIKAQDLERNRNFFLYPEKVFHSLLRQREDFELKTN